jgi:hypothetical protein
MNHANIKEVVMYKCSDDKMYEDKMDAFKHELYLSFNDEYNKLEFVRLDDCCEDFIEFDHLWEWMKGNANFIKRIAEVL